MYSRVTLLEIDTMRASVADVVARFEREVVPRLREQAGFEGTLALATPEGKGLLITLWASEDAVLAAAGFATAALDEFATLFRSPPGREYYQVEYLELLGVVTGA